MDLNLKLRMEDFHSHWCISDRDPIVIPLQVPFSLDNQFASISEMFTNSEPHQRIDMMLLLDGLRANPLPAIVDNPLVSVTRGRPAGALNNSRPMVRDNSTTRDSSAFEFVEGPVNSRRKCGNAGNGNPDVPCRSFLAACVTLAVVVVQAPWRITREVR